MSDFTRALAANVRQNRGFFGALILLSVLYITYNFMHPRGFSTAVLVQNANEVVAIAFVAMAQTLPVLLGGLDLSVGAVMTLAACIASELVHGSPAQIMLGMVITLMSGAAFGLMNGLIIVYGRLQPIIATLATGAIAMGLALFIRPNPGGNVDSDLNWAMTNSLWDFVDTYKLFDPDAGWFQPLAWIPVPFIFLFGIAAATWIPFRRSVTGRTVYAIGSSEGAAFMSGLPLNRAKIAAFTLGGFFAACGGLYLAIQTSSGNADITQAGTYTLNSIAAVVLGGTSLMGGVGSAIGSLVGALILRVISFYFRIVSIDPLLQPLVEGIVLLAAVSLGAIRTLRVKNRLDLFR
ncbi:ABC transporter permease [Devosia sp. J2-20]|jgi:ribose transport system permease protein|uniref:ABC transporter permease n=1 Tax=Devosia litorisediminis TaxID=2829817 RepID=A0A942I4N4_9HYPH|nr:MULTISPECIES: ABC transporter permease [Devosia]MBS3847596.1 ABC transporter permease [Devosia litorisediminis]MCZ4347042.1 ABC transporter permease [Devosia neptuniae]WDQ99282.1 ABC transporter permease [Devosia sp. J2-20]|tara:strand:- start:765 stop:1814 length:1050 start_codon:yes stop_codon:yes gene_type:complete